MSEPDLVPVHMPIHQMDWISPHSHEKKPWVSVRSDYFLSVYDPWTVHGDTGEESGRRISTYSSDALTVDSTWNELGECALALENGSILLSDDVQLSQ